MQVGESMRKATAAGVPVLAGAGARGWPLVLGQGDSRARKGRQVPRRPVTGPHGEAGGALCAVGPGASEAPLGLAGRRGSPRRGEDAGEAGGLPVAGGEAVGLGRTAWRARSRDGQKQREGEARGGERRRPRGRAT